MGIKELTKLIQSTQPQAIEAIETSHLEGWSIAIDTKLFLYKYVRGGIFMASTQTEIENVHLRGVLTIVSKMLELNMKPIFVFDGKTPQEKSSEVKNRIETANKNKQDFERAIENGETSRVEVLFKRTIPVTSKHQEETKKLIRLLGLPVVSAPFEGENQCASLVKSGFANAVATDDMDALPFGSPLTIRGIESINKSECNIRLYHLDKILSGWNMTMDQFLETCIMCGCDYTKRIPGIGIKKAYDGMKKHGSLHTFVQNLKKSKNNKVPQNYLEEAEIAKNAFKTQETHQFDQNNREHIELFEWKEPRFDELKTFLVEEKGVNQEFFDAEIKRLKLYLRGTVNRKRAREGSDSRVDDEPGDKYVRFE